MKERVGRLSLVFAGCGLALLLSEGLIRVFYPHARDHVIPGRLFTIDDDLGWKFHPRTSGRHHSRYFNVVYTINSLGFRDKPREIAKHGETHRILLYGDSLIFGWGVLQQERFSDLTESRSHGLEIWNHGVPGYGLDQEILLYEKEGEALKANEAMFFVAGSSLHRLHTGYIYQKYKPMFELGSDGRLKLIGIPKGKNAATSLFYDVFSPFYLPYFLEIQFASFKEALNSRGMRTAAGGVKTRRYIGEFEKKLLRMAWNTARERHQSMTLLVVNIPLEDRKDLRDFCDENGMGYLEISSDFTAGFGTDDKSDLILGKYDKHWNAKANKLIADQLLSQMKQGRYQFLFETR
jgi:hypothetical protein